jgi:hypothetical protein
MRNLGVAPTEANSGRQTNSIPVAKRTRSEADRTHRDRTRPLQERTRSGANELGPLQERTRAVANELDRQERTRSGADRSHRANEPGMVIIRSVVGCVKRTIFKPCQELVRFTHPTKRVECDSPTHTGRCRNELGPLQERTRLARTNSILRRPNPSRPNTIGANELGRHERTRPGADRTHFRLRRPSRICRWADRSDYAGRCRGFPGGNGP